jgi:hypothetical protein
MPLYRARVVDTFDSSCQAGDAVGNLVYSKADDEVETIDITDSSKMPAVGIILEKITATTCVVQTFGPYEIAGLTPGQRYWAGAAGTPSNLFPTASPGGIAIAQVIGFAHTTDELILDPELQAHKLREP